MIRQEVVWQRTTNKEPHQNKKPIEQIIITSKLNNEIVRLATFQNWDSKFSVAKENLARQGFYYTNDHDVVKCYFCEVEVGQWNHDDDEYTEHKRWSPHCPLLTSFNTTNNSLIDFSLLNTELQLYSID
jgi:hypothetical protein